MRRFFLFLLASSIAFGGQAQKDSVKINAQAKNITIKPVTGLLVKGNPYRAVPWLHNFLDTAQDFSINKFLRETSDSLLQLVNYETETALHAYYLDNGRNPNDKDGDGLNSYQSGGADCDDMDPYAYPGNSERCNGYFKFSLTGRSYILIYRYHDEDCNPCSIAGYAPDGDEDNDEQLCNTCLNYSRYSTIVCQYAVVPTSSALSLGNPKRQYTVRGWDCDDTNPALRRADQKCIGAQMIAVCEKGAWRYYPCRKCITQPNGTGVVVE